MNRTRRKHPTTMTKALKTFSQVLLMHKISANIGFRYDSIGEEFGKLILIPALLQLVSKKYVFEMNLLLWLMIVVVGRRSVEVKRRNERTCLIIFIAVLFINIRLSCSISFIHKSFFLLFLHASFFLNVFESIHTLHASNHIFFVLSFHF